MSKELKVLKKNFGDPIKTPNVSLKVPDDVYEVFKDYAIEIVTYPEYVSSIFAVKNNEDVDSVIFRGTLENHNGFINAVKGLHEKLKGLKEVK